MATATKTQAPRLGVVWCRRSTTLGIVPVEQDHEILPTIWNGLDRSVRDTLLSTHQCEVRYVDADGVAL